jgi:DNA mismatch repair protein MutL
MDPSEVDVNIHPTKREVRFRNGRQVFAAVQKAVRHTLMREHSVPVARARTMPITSGEWNRRQQITRVQRPKPVGRSEWGLEMQRTADQEPHGSTAQRKLTGLPMLRVLGQLGRTYVIAEGPDGMYLVDQHTAHERILYERLKGQDASAEVPSQALLEPVAVELSPHQGAAIDSHQDFLKQLGFDVEPFGGSSYLVRSVPASLVNGDIATALAEMLEGTEQGDTEASWEERALLTVVCHSAVRAGKTMTSEEMRDLVRQLEETSLPHTCPHGRPTMVHLSQTQLEREFGR